MRPAVVTAVLLLVCFLDTVTARALKYPYSTGGINPDIQCGDGWSRIDENRCAKFIESPKTFHDAQEHCRTLNGDLVSAHSLDQILRLFYLIWHADTEVRDLWIGAIRSEGGLRLMDGSELKPGKEECLCLNFSGEAHFTVAQCSEKNHFVCAKEM